MAHNRTKARVGVSSGGERERVANFVGALVVECFGKNRDYRRNTSDVTDEANQVQYASHLMLVPPAKKQCQRRWV